MSGLPERVEADLIETKLGPEAQKAIARRFGTRDWSHWTRAECFEIANEAPSAYGEHAREIYDALSACDFRALIPFTSKEEVYNDGNHD